MHFPGKLKVYRVAKTWVYFHTLDTSSSNYDSEEAKLTEYAASLLRKHLANYSEPAILQGLTPHVEDKDEVEQCLRKAVAAGYEVNQVHDEKFHAYTELYMTLDSLVNVPTVIFFTVPDKTAIPSSVKASIQSWRDLDPGFNVAIHDTHDLETLVELLMPELQRFGRACSRFSRSTIIAFSSRHFWEVMCVQILFYKINFNRTLGAEKRLLPYAKAIIIIMKILVLSPPQRLL
jgi:mannosyltransferase OCH1-like enzyme